jgi:hypothetical protein
LYISHRILTETKEREREREREEENERNVEQTKDNKKKESLK